MTKEQEKFLGEIPEAEVCEFLLKRNPQLVTIETDTYWESHWDDPFYKFEIPYIKSLSIGGIDPPDIELIGERGRDIFFCE